MRIDVNRLWMELLLKNGEGENDGANMALVRNMVR